MNSYYRKKADGVKKKRGNVLKVELVVAQILIVCSLDTTYGTLHGARMKEKQERFFLKAE